AGNQVAGVVEDRADRVAAAAARGGGEQKDHDQGGGAESRGDCQPRSPPPAVLHLPLLRRFNSKAGDPTREAGEPAGPPVPRRSGRGHDPERVVISPPPSRSWGTAPCRSS